MLHIATGCSNSTLYCLELNRKHTDDVSSLMASDRYDTHLRRYKRVNLKMSFFAKI